MRPTSTYRGLPAGNPLANVLVIVVGVLAIAASVVLGFFAFIVIGSFVLVMASIIGIRIWWLKRKLGTQGGSTPGERPSAEGGVIEGEYRVVADDHEGE